MSTQSFASLGVSNAVVDALSKDGIVTPFPIQRRVLPDALDGRDLFVRSPTGSGKSLAFGVPMVDSIEATDRAPSRSCSSRRGSSPRRSSMRCVASPMRVRSASPPSTAAPD